ncbi:hypothetical protein FOG48_03437 [Hanseniaspora uvarum]|nr:hypothetical protein FOG48_03437 [Hanseniaspora uvarum]
MLYLQILLFILPYVQTTLSSDLKETYSDYKLIRCTDHIDPEIFFQEEVDIWSRNQDFTDIMVHNKDIKKFDHCQVINDIQTLLDEETNSEDDENVIDTNQLNELFPFDTFDFDDNNEFIQDFKNENMIEYNGNHHNNFFKKYRNLEDIYEYMESLAYKYANLVKLEDIGTTFEGRDIKAMHISAHDVNENQSHRKNNPNKKTVVITSGLHAREWATITTTLWIATKLAAKYGNFKKETFYLNNLDFFIIPVFNPDGYEYTWRNDRLWRKTRQQTSHPRCFGIDLDHSFDFQWTDNDTPCSVYYSGQSPFESLESKALNEYLFDKKNNDENFKLHGFIDFHSYGQEILYPYGFSCDLQPRDIENLLELSYGMARSIRLKTGEAYEVMPSCKDKGSDLIPGFGSGNALDYFYHSKAHWAFQFKIRDLGEKGFILPKKYIKPVARENYAAVKHFCDFILNPEL